ncbi:BglII/BstYI family type II restriction endonuclease [Elusimicrobiota bacterium]
MKFERGQFHCGERLLGELSGPINEIEAVINGVFWSRSFRCDSQKGRYDHQAGYNKAFEKDFISRGWETQPLLREAPKLIGDFRKGLVFVEVQFGNSSALYRDYYKFQYGLAEGLLSLAVLIVPFKAKEFFPTRPASVQNMAEFGLAKTCFSVLPLNVPTVLIGLLPEN